MGCSSSRQQTLPSQAEQGNARPTLLAAAARQRRARGRLGEGSDHEKPDLKAGASSSKASGQRPGEWELELCEVSEELKQKLQQPTFVASRCALDGSDDLDMHELKDAARGFGIRFRTDSQKGQQELLALMAGQQRISKERFAEIVAARCHPPFSAYLQRAVPHALRGMALGQLQDVEAVFVKPGWLTEQCESFNADNSQAILEGKTCQQAPNFYAMDMFVVSPMSKTGPCAARLQDVQNNIPEAKGTSSFSELMNPHGLYVHCFVSHCWGHAFHSTVRTLSRWAEDNFRKIHPQLPRHPKAVVFWMCLFALNQHEAGEEIGEHPKHAPFNAALAQASAGAVVILDEEINPFKRIWCLFEIWRLKDFDVPLELLTEAGSVTSPTMVSGSMSEMLHAICNSLWQVSAAKAQSSVEDDRYRIWEQIVDTRFKGSVAAGGAQAFFDHAVDEHGLEGVSGYFSEFDHYIRSRLSTSILQVLLDCREYLQASTCCVHGALFTEEQLYQICSSARFSTRRQRTAWLNNMLVRAIDSAPMVRLLLDHAADANAMYDSGHSVLMIAALGGHQSVAKLLLDHGADARNTGMFGQTALLCAAFAGHEPMAKLLLERGAVAGATTDDGTTALTVAALDGRQSFVHLLLQHRADVRASSSLGYTPLMLVASRGHQSAAEVLLQNSADVGATDNFGQTALMHAACAGHRRMLSLLLEHGADVRVTNSQGATALGAAAQGGHDSSVRLLLHHGANVESRDDDGHTALMLASAGGHLSAALLLVESSADVRATDNFGQSSLMHAASAGHGPVVSLLLEYGADVHAANSQGADALSVAEQGGHDSLVRLLMQHGSDVEARDDAGQIYLNACFCRRPPFSRTCAGLRSFCRSLAYFESPVLAWCRVQAANSYRTTTAFSVSASSQGGHESTLQSMSL